MSAASFLRRLLGRPRADIGHRTQHLASLCDALKFCVQTTLPSRRTWSSSRLTTSPTGASFAYSSDECFPQGLLLADVGRQQDALTAFQEAESLARTLAEDLRVKAIVGFSSVLVAGLIARKVFPPSSVRCTITSTALRLPSVVVASRVRPWISTLVIWPWRTCSTGKR